MTVGKRVKKWRKINFLVAVYSRKLNSARLRRFNLRSLSRLSLARVRNKFRWLLVRESTPLVRLSMRRHERWSWSGRRIIQRTDNTHSGPVFCRRDKLRRPLNARFLPAAAAVFRTLRAAHMDDALCCASSWRRCRTWDTETLTVRKSCEIFYHEIFHIGEKDDRCFELFRTVIFYFRLTTFMYFLSNSFCSLYVFV